MVIYTILEEQYSCKKLIKHFYPTFFFRHFIFQQFCVIEFCIKLSVN